MEAGHRHNVPDAADRQAGFCLVVQPGGIPQQKGLGKGSRVLRHTAPEKLLHPLRKPAGKEPDGTGITGQGLNIALGGHQRQDPIAGMVGVLLAAAGKGQPDPEAAFQNIPRLRGILFQINQHRILFSLPVEAPRCLKAVIGGGWFFRQQDFPGNGPVIQLVKGGIIAPLQNQQPGACQHRPQQDHRRNTKLLKPQAQQSRQRKGRPGSHAEIPGIGPQNPGQGKHCPGKAQGRKRQPAHHIPLPPVFSASILTPMRESFHRELEKIVNFCRFGGGNRRRNGPAKKDLQLHLYSGKIGTSIDILEE